MLKSPRVWLAAIWIGVMIHLDWHLGRPGHDHRSFDFVYHWLLAIPAFAPIAWLVHRRWPGRAYAAGAVIILLGVLLGQGLEPLGEVIHFGAGAEPFTNRVRWRIFAEFLIAGVLVFLVVHAVVSRRGKAGEPKEPLGS